MTRINKSMKALIKRVVVGLLGGTITVIGVVALVTPGPGWLIIFAGLGILATEFAWAAIVLERAKKSASRAANRARLKKEHRDILLAVLFSLSLIALVVWYTSIR
jgi:uncharacterized protein (TIGR02611 family)